MIRKTAICLTLAALAACSPSTQDDQEALVSLDSSPSTSPVSTPPIPRLSLNEVMVLNTEFPAGAATYLPWIEVTNSGKLPVSLADLTLKTDQASWLMPNVLLEPGDYYVLQGLQSVDGSPGTFLQEGTQEISIVDVSGETVDLVHLPMPVANESFARYPNGTGDFSVYPRESVTFGGSNPDTGFITRRASVTEFRPRDSSPNAVLRYDNAFWILGGWSNFAHDVWYSYTDVWRSYDGASWELINPAPPYIHYCSYVAWKGRMWAVGPASFSSSDGVNWRPEALRAAGSSRSVIFNELLINISGSRVQATYNGNEWFTLTNSTPWGAQREEMMAVVHRGKIWVMGGVSGYGTPQETYYNDVWSSPNGFSWKAETPSAAWSPRMWSSAITHDDKIFVIDGWNRTAWPDQYGNVSEIWFSSNGKNWFELKSEQLWEARHASLSVSDGEGGVLLMAGYGHGGVKRIHNDVWNLKASLYFPKQTGALYDLRTWGKNEDGSGSAPRSFGAPNQLFVLRNRKNFAVDDRWSVRGAGSRIVVGDGDRNNRVSLEISNGGGAAHPLYLSANSTTVARGNEPTVLLRDPEAILSFE